MASFTARTHPTTRTAPWFDPRTLAAALLCHAVAADERYRASRRLEETPDHLLDDMGITRSELQRMLEEQRLR